MCASLNEVKQNLEEMANPRLGFVTAAEVHEHSYTSMSLPYGLLHCKIERKAFPYGTVTVQIVQGGLLPSSGIVLPEQGDDSDQMVIVDAVVVVGY